MTDERVEPQYISEVYRVKAKKWVELNKAAHMLEECKSSFFSQRMLDQDPDVSINRAEVTVKASEVWKGYLESMVAARAAANLARADLAYWDMRFKERMSEEANARAERKL